VWAAALVGCVSKIYRPRRPYTTGLEGKVGELYFLGSFFSEFSETCA
jgi:hypothetical protein